MRPPTTKGRKFLTSSGFTSRPPREVPLERNASSHLDALRMTTLRDEQDLVRQAITLRDEPECISTAILNGYAESARFHQTQQHQAAVLAAQQTRPQLSAENRLKDAQARAKRAHRKDLSGEFLALKHMLERSRRTGQPANATTLARLERVEAKLDGLDLAA